MAAVSQDKQNDMSDPELQTIIFPLRSRALRLTGPEPTCIA
jgi:hypothetical protein